MKRKHILTMAVAAMLLRPIEANGHPGHGTSPEGTIAHMLDHALPALLLLAAVMLGCVVLRWLQAR